MNNHRYHSPKILPELSNSGSLPGKAGGVPVHLRPSLSNSPGMRGAPQSGLARHICRIRSIVSGATRGRPAFRARLFQRQNRRKPCRCQWITVSGWTSRIVCRQRLQTRERQTQKTRSTGLIRGRLVFRLKTRSWCRSAAFSRSKWCRELIRATARRSPKFNQPNMPRNFGENSTEAEDLMAGWNYCQRQVVKTSAIQSGRAINCAATRFPPPTGEKSDGTYKRIWSDEAVSGDEVLFDAIREGGPRAFWGGQSTRQLLPELHLGGRKPACLVART